MKTLSTIQTLFKIGRVLSKVVYICDLVAAIACAVTMLSLPFGDSGIIKFGDVTLYGMIMNTSNVDVDSLYPLLAGTIIICIGQAITAKFAELYFTHELEAGTPFTRAGAKELLRLGIQTICIPLGTLILAQIVASIITEFLGCSETFKPDEVENVALGVMFIIMSLLCKYGAEVTGEQGLKKAEELQEESV